MKKILKYGLLILLTISFNACVNQKQLTREEWIKNTTRMYTNLDKETAINAAEKVLKLADGDDFVIMHDENGFYATRNWSAYLVIAAASGTDYWRFNTKEENGKLKLSIQINTQSQSMTPLATSSGNYSIFTTPMSGSPENGTSIYNLFWSRFDYIIGRNNHWMSCKESDKLNSENKTWGLNEALCNSFNIKNDVPEGVVKDDLY